MDAILSPANVRVQGTYMGWRLPGKADPSEMDRKLTDTARNVLWYLAAYGLNWEDWVFCPEFRDYVDRYDREGNCSWDRLHDAGLVEFGSQQAFRATDKFVDYMVNGTGSLPVHQWPGEAAA